MATKHQKFSLNLKGYKPVEREAIAIEVIDFIRERTKKGLDKDGNVFPKYTKGYENSLNFKIGGKSKGQTPDLTLSGDMLDSIKMLRNTPEIEIGFAYGSFENAKADGNIRGTYGDSSAHPKRAKPFLGISQTELEKILKKYPKTNKEKSLNRAEIITSAKEAAKEALDIEGE